MDDIYKIISALGGEYIKNKLIEAGYDVIGDIDNQEGLFKILNKKQYDVLILSDSLVGFYSKYGLIKKIKAINKKIKVMVILEENDLKFQDYLKENDVVDFFDNGNFSLGEIMSKLDEYEKGSVQNTKKILLKKENTVLEKEERYLVSLNSQNIFTVFGNTGCGKSLFTYLYSTYLGEKTGMKILVIDLDTEKGDLNLYFNLPNSPLDIDYELPVNKNSSLNYLADMIDKGILTEYNFQRCLVSKKDLKNVYVIPGNTSINVCLNTLIPMYYEKILEIAKIKFDVIFIDISSSLFLDSTQFAVCNSTDLFFVIEPNRLSIERAKRTLNAVCENWNIERDRIKIIVNKYKNSSMEKELIKHLLREFNILGFIPFEMNMESILNEGKVNILKSMQQEFEYLSAEVGITKKVKFMDKLFLK